MSKTIKRVTAKSGLIFLVVEKENQIADKLGIMYGDCLRITRIKNKEDKKDNDRFFYLTSDIQVIRRQNIVKIESPTREEELFYSFMNESPNKEVFIKKKDMLNFNIPDYLFKGEVSNEYISK